MIDFNTLIGFTSGTIGTLIIKELVNQLNKNQDYVRELKKHTYTKKLEKAENAIAFYWTYLNKVTEMKNSLEFVIKVINEIEESDKDIDIIQELIKKTGLSIQELASEKYSSINAVHLYFDLDNNEKWNENDVASLLSSLSETKSIDIEIQFWNDLYENSNKIGDNKNADYYWGKSLELLPSYVNSLQNFIDCIDKNKNAVESIIKAIKSQLKKYE